MAVHRIVLTGLEERYAPPEKEIEVAVVGDRLYISVYDGSLDDLDKGRTRELQVPILSLSEFREVLDMLEKREAKGPVR